PAPDRVLADNGNLLLRPRPEPLGLLLGGGGLLRTCRGWAGASTLTADAGAGTTLDETISPSTACPSVRVTSCRYGLPAASMRRTVARVTVGPDGWLASTDLDASVMVPFLRLARWEMVGPSAFRGTAFHNFATKPFVLGSSSSFFSGFSARASGSTS